MKNNIFKIVSVFFLILLTTYQAQAYVGKYWAGWNVGTVTFNDGGHNWLVEAGVFPTYFPGETIYPGVEPYIDSSGDPNLGSYTNCVGIWCGPAYIGGPVSDFLIDGVNFGHTWGNPAPLTLGSHTFTVRAGGVAPINIPFTVVPYTGYIMVNSNISGAGWTITGPTTLSGSGSALSYSSLPSGSYTITWNAVAGYTKPATQTLTLVAPSTIYFSGTYVANTPTVNLWFSILENIKTFFVGTVFASVNK